MYHSSNIVFLVTRNIPIIRYICYKDLRMYSSIHFTLTIHIYMCTHI